MGASQPTDGADGASRRSLTPESSGCVRTVKLYCPKCGDALTEASDGHLKCVRGQMPLAHELEQRLRACSLFRTRQPRDVVDTHGGQPHSIGGDWFCPGCGVAAREVPPGDLRCPTCSRSLVEFVRSLIELHPHLMDEPMEMTTSPPHHSLLHPISRNHCHPYVKLTRDEEAALATAWLADADETLP